MTLNNLDLAIKNLDQEKKNKFKVFFVSIDPERDSPEVIKDILGRNSMRFILEGWKK